MKLANYLFRTWWVLLFPIGLAAVLIQNRDLVDVSLAPLERMRLPSGTVYLAFFACGAIFSSLLFSTEMLKKSFEIRFLRKKIRQLEKESFQISPEATTTSEELTSAPAKENQTSAVSPSTDAP